MRQDGADPESDGGKWGLAFAENVGARMRGYITGSTDGDFVRFAYMVVFLVLAILIGTLVTRLLGNSEGPNAELEVAPISGAAMDSVDAELDGWADGRDWDWTLKRSEDGTGLRVNVEISAFSNEVARINYCKVLSRDIGAILDARHDLRIELYVDGKIVRACD